jgi:CHAD domain-containing protein
VPVLVDYLRGQRDALVAIMPVARDGDVDAVHDARVTVRRLRATLRTFRPLMDAGQAESIRAELAWLGDLLGAVRDADVLAARLSQQLAEAPPELVVGPVAARIQQRLAAASAQARVDLADGMDSPRYPRVLERLGAIDVSATATPRRLRVRARRAVRRADRRLASAVAALSTRDDAALGRLHEARRAYKRARYAVEVLTPLGPSEARRLVGRLRELQDILGGVQDAAVAERLLRDYGMMAHLVGENAFTYGLLYARQRRGRWEVPGLSRARRQPGRKRLRRFLR